MTSLIQAFYETHPYPHYPLFAQPRWQEGYLASSFFSRRLAGSQDAAQHVGIIGCGEMLAAIIRAWEPRKTNVNAIDLSQKSLHRACFRAYRTTKKITTSCIDFTDANWQHNQPPYDHIDAFGVLHHLPNPLKGLEILSQKLKPGGTMRVMVYNNTARLWIQILQNFFRQKGISAFAKQDIQKAQNFLKLLRSQWHDFAELTQTMGPTFQNKARFADTFLHPQETPVPSLQWFTGFQQNHLRITGIFDRYQELDHLTNPLHAPPNAKILHQHIETFHFQGNLEFFLQKTGPSPQGLKPTYHQRATPPQAWRSHPDLKSIPHHKLWRLWLDWSQNQQRHFTGYSLQQKKRLARIGALWSQDPKIHEPIAPQHEKHQTQQVLQRVTEQVTERSQGLWTAIETQL